MSIFHGCTHDTRTIPLSRVAMATATFRLFCNTTGLEAGTSAFLLFSIYMVNYISVFFMKKRRITHSHLFSVRAESGFTGLFPVTADKRGGDWRGGSHPPPFHTPNIPHHHITSHAPDSDRASTTTRAPLIYSISPFTPAPILRHISESQRCARCRSCVAVVKIKHVLSHRDAPMKRIPHELHGFRRRTMRDRATGSRMSKGDANGSHQLLLSHKLDGEGLGEPRCGGACAS